MYSIPFHAACSEPRTPFWEVMALILGGEMLLLGGDAATEQIRDSGGRTFYRDDLAGSPLRWEDLQSDAARIPNMMRVAMLHHLPNIFTRTGENEHGRIAEFLALNRVPEVYYSTHARPKPRSFVAQAGNAGRRFLQQHGAFAEEASDRASELVDALRLGSLHDFAPATPLPAGSKEVRIAGGAGAYTWAARTPVASHVVTVAAGAAGKDAVLMENMGHAQQAVTFAPDREKVVGIIIVGGSPSLGNARSFAVENLGLRAGQKIRTHYDPDAGALVVENTGDATALDVSVSAGPGSPVGTTRTSVPLGANSVTRFSPDDWTPIAVATGKIRMETLAPATGAPLATTEI